MKNLGNDANDKKSNNIKNKHLEGNIYVFVCIMRSPQLSGVYRNCKQI